MTLTEFQQEKQRERDLIIDIGGQMFLSSGFEGFSIRALTTKLNIPKSNFYTHFQSKRELFYAFKTREYQKFYTKFHSFIEAQHCPLLEKFMRILNFFIDHAINDFLHFQLIFATSAPPSDKRGPIEQEFNAGPNILMREIVRLIDQAIEHGEMKAINSLNCTYFLWALMYGNVQTINRIKTGQLGDYIAYKHYATNEMQRYLKNLLS